MILAIKKLDGFITNIWGAPSFFLKPPNYTLCRLPSKLLGSIGNQWEAGMTWNDQELASDEDMEQPPIWS